MKLEFNYFMNRKSTAILLLLLTACNITGNVVLPPVEEGPPIEVYFCPKDNCNIALHSMLANSSKIVCAMYSLDVPEVRQILKEKNAQLVAEYDNRNDFTGLDAVFDKSGALMHNKFCVLDNKIVITGSYNPTSRKQKANDMIIIPSEFLAKNYLSEFDEMKHGRFGGGNPPPYPAITYNNATIRAAFCPEDNCAEKVLSSLKQAKEKIRFMTYSFTDDEIGDFLAKTSVQVEGIFDMSQNDKYSEYPKLADKSVKRSLHHKVFIIDNSTVITGSFNPTKNGNERNDENLLVINDEKIAARYAEQFSQVRLLTREN